MFLEYALPEMPKALISCEKKDAYGAINQLALFTDAQIKQHNYGTAKRCFAVAEKLYDKGNNIVKSAVQNVFVFSLTRMLSCCPDDRERLLAMVPMGLFTLYVNQVYRSGC